MKKLIWIRDSKGELKEKIGSTGSGTGPANSDRAMRVLKLAKDVDSLSSIIVDVPARDKLCTLMQMKMC